MPKLENPFDNLQISIPGMQRFKDAVATTDANGRISIQSNWLAEYLVGIYNYLIAIVAIVAVLAVAIGGLQWVISGGDAGKVKTAKDWISNALLGLILALSSYAILYLINTDLVKWKTINLTYVKKDLINSIDTIDVAYEGSETSSEEGDITSNSDLITLNTANTGAASITASELLISARLASDFKKAAEIARNRYGIELTISSAYRSFSHQQQLFDAAVKKYGSDAAASLWVAPPSSRAPHVRGVAVDVWPTVKTDENIKKMQYAFRDAGWKRYCREAWHFQPNWAPPKSACSP